MAGVRLQGIAKRFGHQVALRRLDLEIRDRELLTLLGPSGCGKSTVLNLVAGLETPSEGRIWIGDRDVTELGPRERNVAMVFQSYALYPHKTVFENIAFPLKLGGESKSETARRVEETARRLGVGALLQRKPGELSGGQRQRVALGRALVRSPSVFLLDEPLSNLDAQLRTETRAELKRLHGEFGTTTLYVTHDQVEAMTLADRIAVLRDGDLQQCGTPEEIYRLPANRFVAGFVGNPGMNFLPGELTGSGVRLPGVTLPLPPQAVRGLELRAGSARGVVVGIRPEHVTLERRDGAVAVVFAVEPLGAETLVVLSLGEHRLTVRTAPSFAGRPGDRFALHFESGKTYLFDPEKGDRLPVDPF